MLEIKPSGEVCGAQVRGVDLAGELGRETVRAIRAAWLEHHVLAFPDQQLSDRDLERIACTFGALGPDPYFVPIEDGGHVVALTRRADEQAPVFAEAWHTDWSFLPEPPIGTALYSIVVPPVGGDTSFANQQLALATMPAELRARLEGLVALHSARAGYAPDGLYGEREQGSDRSMKIRYDERAHDVYPHPLISRHPESGRERLFGCLGYVVGIEGMADAEAFDLLLELYAWQTREEFQYSHRWRQGMLLLWDNRSVLHRANGGYDGHARELHRVTIAADTARFPH